MNNDSTSKKVAPDADGPTHPAAQPEELLYRQCTVEPLRRSGPGGQRRNKVQTGVRLLHRPTGLRVEAFERRSREENRRAALRRLRIGLALTVRMADDLGRFPSTAWKNRCRGGRLSLAASSAEFPALLAEALDCIALHKADVKQAAEQLGCSTSQLVKLLKREPQAMELVNRWRREQNLPALL